ncbi:LOW QUALITY PROTEIN: IgGFc-binding protein-like [Xenentodon cancila]
MEVDGVLVRLPYSSGSTRIHIYQSSVFSVFLHTAFGVTVQTVWPDFVRVTAPAVYSSSLGGLCGNYNGDPHDDFLTPSGALANSSQEFGDSWRDGSLAAHCVESVNHNTSVNFNTSEYCGILTSRHGPFTSCWAVVDPWEQADICVDILRSSREPASTLCEVLRDYALMCQLRGVSLGQWRNSTGCELACPSNSHYELCGTTCPSAFPSLSFPFTCDTPCQDGCQCDNGFVLNGNQCVPPTSCGCYHHGRYRQSGEQFWDGEECQSLCTCDGVTAAVQCVPNSCGPQESCRVVEGEFGCHPNPHGTCSASGQPHYNTFDAHAYDFQGTCRYVLAAVCNATDEVQHFSVEAKNEAWNGLSVSITAEVFVDVLGHQVLMSRNIPGMVEVDGVLVRLPYSSGSTRIHIYQSSVFSVFLHTAFGVTVQTVWPDFVRVTAPAVYSSSLGGLCGNYNGDPHDDFLTPSGALANSSQEFGDSWRDGSLAAHCVESVNHNTSVNFNTSEYCGILTSRHGSFTSCWAVVDPWEQADVCVDILRGSREPASTLCEVLRDYALMCQLRGVSLGQWRNSTGCELACPSNSHYELCGTTCPSACPSLSFPFTCDTPCQDGCQCDNGFVLNGNQCVPPTSCGCYHHGRYRQSGEFWDGEECQSLCTCDGVTAAVQCVPNSCGPQEMCRVVEGEFGCHPNPHGTCSASGHPHYNTFDGHAYDFQGTCRYVLAAVCNATDEVQHFSVEAKNEAWNGLSVSITAEVFVDVLGHQVLMSRNIPGMVEVS